MVTYQLLNSTGHFITVLVRLINAFARNPELYDALKYFGSENEVVAVTNHAFLIANVRVNLSL